MFISANGAKKGKTCTPNDTRWKILGGVRKKNSYVDLLWIVGIGRWVMR